MRIFWLIKGDLIGVSTRLQAVSEHFICPACGENWAQVLCDGESEHFVHRRSCPDHEAHPNTFNRAILTEFFAPVSYLGLDIWGTIVPREVLVRDFMHLYGNHVNP